MQRKMKFYTEDLRRPVRLDRFIAGKLDFFKREQWKSEIISGRLLVNNSIVTSRHKKINPGDIVEYLCRHREEPEIDSDIKTIYEDEYIIAINKTGNLPVHPSGIYYNNTLLSILEKKFNTKLYLIHRLDRETSGTIIVGKSSEAAREFQYQLKDAQKTYNAIVFGAFPEEIQNKTPLGPAYNLKQELNTTKYVKKKRAAYAGAIEKAETNFKTIKTFKDFSLVEAMPKTGRLHQIRVHLSNLGYPIVGDKIYGYDETCYLEFLSNGLTARILNIVKAERCMLHAISLEIYHPFINKEMTFKAPLPKDMENFIRGLK